jgi:hypothetical protein
MSRKCHGTCGVCPACKHRASKGVQVVPPSTEPALSAREFERRAAEEATDREHAAERSMERAREGAYLRRQGIYDE